jgi:hypothetical protein
MKLAIVTATTNPRRADACISTWGDTPLVIILNGVHDAVAAAESTTIAAHWIVNPEYLGTVPAFRLGVDYALEQTDADVIACLHDDLEIHETEWAEKVLRHFERYPSCGLLGFGGAVGLGDADIYQKPYDPMQLARIGFRSNLVDAEQHGMRSLLAERVACLDGFSQIGRRTFWLGANPPLPDDGARRPWTVLEQGGVTHHFYDGLLGCLARRYGWGAWYLPVRGRHLGGQTAVGDPGYQAWAKEQHVDGDHGFWEYAHRWGYDNFLDVLPLRV